MNKILLSATNLTKQYTVNFKTRTVLKNINLEVVDGETLSLIGVNGAGKSTLLKLLTGFSQPTTGRVTINQQPVSDPRSRKLLGYLPENPQFYADITGYDFLLFTASLFELTPAVARTAADQLLTDFSLSSAGRLPVRTYSKGMRQRLGFAQALIGQPKLLLLDEPLDGLDPLGRRTLKNRLLKLKKQRVTIIVCSHILSDLDELSDRIGVIHQGELKIVTTTNKFKQQKTLEEAFVDYLSKI